MKEAMQSRKLGSDLVYAMCGYSFTFGGLFTQLNRTRPPVCFSMLPVAGRRSGRAGRPFLTGLGG